MIFPAEQAHVAHAVLEEIRQEVSSRALKRRSTNEDLGAITLSSGIAERPVAMSPDFSYFPAGDITANSGNRKPGGRADFTAYSQIRFPLEKAPAFAHSQSFMKRRAREKTDELAGGHRTFCRERIRAPDVRREIHASLQHR